MWEREAAANLRAATREVEAWQQELAGSKHGGGEGGLAQLVATLDGALTQQRGVLQALRRKQRARQEARRLRTEQDRDYQEGLERDRLREAQRQAEREENERRARAEREAREQAELEAAHARLRRHVRHSMHVILQENNPESYYRDVTHMRPT